jgi:uncharacterized protein YceK
MSPDHEAWRARCVANEAQERVWCLRHRVGEDRFGAIAYAIAAILFAAAAIFLSSCSTVAAIIAPEPLACDVRANLRCSTDPATGIQVCAVYCRTRLLWRQNCDGAVIRSGRLYCGDVGVLRLPGDVSEVAQ